MSTESTNAGYVFELETSSWDAFLVRIGILAESLEPVKQGALVLEQLVRQTFRDQRDPWGNSWLALSPVTIAARQRNDNFSVAALLATGDHLYNSIGTAQVADGYEVAATDESVFPKVHQFGNPLNRAWGRGSAPIPARPFFPIREEGVDMPDSWIAQLYRPVDDALKQAVEGGR